MRHAAAVFMFAMMTLTSAIAADATDPERLAEARAVLAAMHVDRQLDRMSGVMADSMSKQLVQGRSNPNPRVLQVLMEEAMRGMKERLDGPGGLADSIAQAYATQFTFAELRQIREFYQSPAGQRLLQASPEIMQQVMPKAMEASRAGLPGYCARAKERLVAEKVEGAEKLTCPGAP